MEFDATSCHLTIKLTLTVLPFKNIHLLRLIADINLAKTFRFLHINICENILNTANYYEDSGMYMNILKFTVIWGNIEI